MTYRHLYERKMEDYLQIWTGAVAAGKESVQRTIVPSVAAVFNENVQGHS